MCAQCIPGYAKAGERTHVGDVSLGSELLDLAGSKLPLVGIRDFGEQGEKVTGVRLSVEIDSLGRGVECSAPGLVNQPETPTHDERPKYEKYKFQRAVRPLLALFTAAALEE
jgi:hypothetical protein